MMAMIDGVQNKIDPGDTQTSRIYRYDNVGTPTAPAFRVRPSIIDASSSTVPSLVSTAPRPELKSGESSITVMAAMTASRLDRPALISV